MKNQTKLAALLLTLATGLVNAAETAKQMPMACGMDMQQCMKMEQCQKMMNHKKAGESMDMQQCMKMEHCKGMMNHKNMDAVVGKPKPNGRNNVFE